MRIHRNRTALTNTHAEKRVKGEKTTTATTTATATTALVQHVFRTDPTIATADLIERVLLYSVQVKRRISSVERAHTIHSTPSGAYLPTAGLEGGPLGRKGGAELEDDDYCKAVSSLQEAWPTYGSGAGSLLKKKKGKFQ
jgi:hypothetical protein